MAAMLRLALSAMSSARLSILIFHRVPLAADPLLPGEPDAAAFEQQMRWVRDWFNVLPLVDAVGRLYEGRLPARALAITFDDGYADNAEVAAPILRRLGLTATFFVSTGFLDGGCMFNDRIIEAIRSSRTGELDLARFGLGRYALETIEQKRGAIEALLRAVKHLDSANREAAVEKIVQASAAPPAPSLMMQPSQVRALRALGMDVGAHTVHHPILTRLAIAEAQREIVESKAYLEDLLREPVPLFAYPNGVPGRDYAPEHVRLVRECGFAAAVSTSWGAASSKTDRYQLPRFTPWDRSRLRYGTRLLLNLRRAEQSVPEQAPASAAA
jgi:peptidoglycan/xylan/chitin deacetylase (PgdA/CDA1 family)